MIERLTRPAEGALLEERAAFGRELLAVLTRLGVGPGDDFLVSAHEGRELGVDEKTLGRFAAQSETSRKAALDNYPNSGIQRHTVFVAVAEAGPRGVISDEIADAKRIRLYSVKPRLIELREGGWVRQNGETRPSPTGSDVDVYVLTEKGAAEYAKREGREVHREQSEPAAALFDAPAAPEKRPNFYDPE